METETMDSDMAAQIEGSRTDTDSVDRDADFNIYLSNHTVEEPIEDDKEEEEAISSLPEFEEKKFQKVAKEGSYLDGDTEAAKKHREAVKRKFKSLTKWLSEDALKDYILHAQISERLVDSPIYLNQKKALEINTRHPLIKELLKRVKDNPQDTYAKEMAIMMFNTATLR